MTYEELRSESFTNQGFTINYKIGGEGHPLLFLHGFPDFSYSWRYQVPAFAKNYQLILPDLRGYNQNSKPPQLKYYGLDSLKDDIIGLLDHLQIEKATIVAHDWGGGTAWVLAAKHPDRLHKLIIMNMPHVDEFRKQIFSNFQQFKRSWYALAFQIPFLPELFFHQNPGWFFKTVFEKRSTRPEHFCTKDLEMYKAAFPDIQTWRATLNYYRAFFRYPYQPRPLPKIEVPCGMIWGSKDHALGKELASASQGYCNHFLGIKYIEDASHWLQHEYPEEVNGHLDYFLSL
ncbi:MAG: alpha/beta hydrolase [Bacteroidia bacterium]|nr:alpha/beta hydrolase [Bacteroidia bacterium]